MPGCDKFYQLRCESQCEKDGTTIKVLKQCAKEMVLRSISLYF